MKKCFSMALGPLLLSLMGCGPLLTQLADPDDSPQTVAELKTQYEPVEAAFLEGYNKMRGYISAGIEDSATMRLAMDYALNCQKAGSYLERGPNIEDAKWRHLPKPLYKAHPEFDWGNMEHALSGTVPEDTRLYPEDHEFETEHGTQVFSEMKAFCKQKYEVVSKLQVPGCYVHTAEAFVPWLGPGDWGDAIIRIPTWSCPAKKTSSHDLSSQLSDDPIACEDVPKEDVVPEPAVPYHKRLKKMYCPDGVVEYEGDLFSTTKEGCERARYTRMYCYAKVDEVPTK
ncbi:MAG: hypothetical protein CMH56_06270 [Myxococcales bacterium]|nr:hypothetical protein [Myxococcales bacterium]|tara:strand:- start:598 stop:1452 length:855 start_codon:yes stop_codon:yes gene_type:complete